MSTHIRRVLACLASFAIGVRFFQLFHHEANHVADRLFIDATILVPFAAGALIWWPALAAQLLARGAWWSMLLCGGLVAVTADDSFQALGALLASGTAIALLAAGRTGLGARPGFAPVAFRGTLLVALVLAMADAGAFTWFGVGNAMFEGSYSVLLVVPAMAAGVIGLLRLRTWGLVVSLATNLAVAILAATGVLALPGPVRPLFIGSAVLQLLVPLPMIVAIVRRRPPAAEAWSRVRVLAPMLIIVAIAALALYATYIQRGPLVPVA